MDNVIIAGSGTVTPCASANSCTASQSELFATAPPYDALKFAAKSMKSLMLTVPS